MSGLLAQNLMDLRKLSLIFSKMSEYLAQKHVRILAHYCIVKTIFVASFLDVTLPTKSTYDARHKSEFWFEKARRRVYTARKNRQKRKVRGYKINSSSVDFVYRFCSPNKISELDCIHAELKFITDRLRDDDVNAEFQSEWKAAARVFDR